MNPQWKNSRKLEERVLIEGILMLETPTHLGNGDTDSPLDMPLLVDALDGKALLPGSSLAGALRQILDEKSANALFGYVKGSESRESYLLVDDALAQEQSRELRDGVAIDPRTRTAEKNKKFDVELLAAGTKFPISLEILIPRSGGENLIRYLAVALSALEWGDIHLGKRKRRGFGKCKVTTWKVCRYDMTTLEGLKGWLNQEKEGFCQEGSNIAELLGVDASAPPLQGFHIRAVFALEGSFLIRSGFGEPSAPDVVHLHSQRNGKEVPVLSGTSLAGALRARARRIANTVHGEGQGEVWTDRIFGNRNMDEQRKDLTASRLWVGETVIEDPLELVQTRLKIDRFTGGSYPNALFNEQAVWGQLEKETLVSVDLYLEPPWGDGKNSEPEVGLLLLLLKDLWTGDLPLGGESSIGRGRLRGIRAELSLNDETWAITSDDAGQSLEIQGDRDRLEAFVRAFVNGGA